MTVAILAGGQSLRMGTDKARLEAAGTPLLEHLAQTALSADFPVLVVGRVRPPDWPLDGVKFAEDVTPGLGPLGGLQTALRQANTPIIAVACDMPRLTLTALCWLSEQAAERDGSHGLAVQNNGQWEPLFSVYTPSCLPLIESRLTAGRLSLHGLIEAGDFSRVDAPDWIAPRLVNVNTPEDLAHLLP